MSTSETRPQRLAPPPSWLDYALEYATVDVFAERPFEGNQLAVFADGRGLTTEQMQAIARETNLSETTFILPGDPAEEAADGVRVRIFTIEEELPFAGHPTLGTASWLWWNHATLRGANRITLRLNAGAIPVDFSPPAYGGDDGVYATMRQNQPVFSRTFTAQETAPALGVPVEDLEPGLPVQVVSTGNPFAIVPFRSLEALSRLEIPQTAAKKWLAQAGARFFYCIAPADEAADGFRFRARMQFYNGEDPATGSAAGCAIAWLVRYGIVPSGVQATIAQGMEMCRPSQLTVSALCKGEEISDVFVSGRTISVAEGRFRRPL